MSAQLLVDMLLGTLLAGLAGAVAFGRHLFRSIVFYVAFGLAMAVVWARLGAPDLALADAAIGAGLTGALMLVAFRRLVEIDPERAEDEGTRPTGAAAWIAVAVAVLVAALVAIVGLTALSIEPAPLPAGVLVMNALDETGLGNPITAVLLVFRGFDTLIEMVVLLTALVAARVVTSDAPHRSFTLVAEFDLPLVRTLVAVVVPLAVLVALHLLWVGADDPGGAFQAGSVLAGAGVALMLSGTLVPTARSRAPMRLAAVAGVAALSVLLVVPMPDGRPPLAFLGRGSLLFAEAAMMVSIAVTLSLLFAGAPGLRRGLQ
ncbi:MAG: hydrogenase subunit MbhD domain-containing protein [Wenzhouxiangellaceae bacterium]|nr:hydrogenase subunit MbhD domain-containing protein [Wenzhouxiangellaceae bacterium]